MLSRESTGRSIWSVMIGWRARRQRRDDASHTAAVSGGVPCTKHTVMSPTVAEFDNQSRVPSLRPKLGRAKQRPNHPGSAGLRTQSAGLPDEGDVLDASRHRGGRARWQRLGGQPLPRMVRLEMTASHSVPHIGHSHHTFLLLADATESGVRAPLSNGCHSVAISGG